MKNKKAQAWGTDIMIGSFIFFSVLTLFYIYSINYSNDSNDKLETLKYEGEYVSESIFSEGYPINWTNNTVIKIGILSNNKINQTKIELFYNLSIQDYEKTKALFNTNYDYYFLLDSNISLFDNTLSIKGIGKEPTNPKNLIKITRLTTYNQKPQTAYLYIFE